MLIDNFIVIIALIFLIYIFLKSRKDIKKINEAKKLLNVDLGKIMGHNKKA